MNSFESIPAELCALHSWVCWRIVERGGRATKMPVQPNGAAASSTDPSTWSSFGECVAIVKRGGFAGLGFVFTKAAGYVGIDLDKCRDPEREETEPWARRIIRELDSYTELSQSGCGWHIVVRGKLPEGGNRRGRVEMYDCNRFFVMTGNIQFAVGSSSIRSVDLASLHRRMLAGALDPVPQEHVAGRMETGGSDSEEDFRLIGEIQWKLRTRDAEKIEREFARLYPARYSAQNKKHGMRGRRTYIRYSIERLLERDT